MTPKKVPGRRYSTDIPAPFSPRGIHDAAILGAGTPLDRLPQGVISNSAQVTRVAEILARLEGTNLPFREKLDLVQRLDLWPFITGSRLHPEFRLLIEMEPDLKEQKIYRIERSLSEGELNGELSISPADLTLLATIPEPHLIFSAHDIHRYAPAENLEMIFQLFSLGRRITRYRGVSVTWDQNVDAKVWTTNIDTVFFMKTLFAAGVFHQKGIRKVLEVGVGGGGISKSLVHYLPDLVELLATDISPYALIASKRNIAPILKPHQGLSLYLGKGIRDIDTQVDMMVVNPPYIPPLGAPDAADPYRGTGLIQEILALGPQKLVPDHPDAPIYMGISSLAQSNLDQYLGGMNHIRVERLGESLEVPLKILNVNENRSWIDFLVQEHGLVQDAQRLVSEGFEFWHRLSVLKITRK